VVRGAWWVVRKDQDARRKTMDGVIDEPPSSGLVPRPATSPTSVGEDMDC
jgi:hypothetical protein